MEHLAAVYNWLAKPTTHLHDALVALASVGVVLWTGGLIVRQLTNYMDVPFRLGMEFCAFGFLAPTVALVFTGNSLRIFAAIFLASYVYNTIFVVLRQARDAETGKVSPPRNIPVPISDEKWKENNWRSYQGAWASNLAILIVVVFPFDQPVAIAAFFMTFLGYQLFLSRLYRLGQDLPDSVYLTLIARALAAIDQRLAHVISNPAPQPPPVTPPPSE